MPRENLTPAFVTKAPAPPTDRTIYWDTKLSGFGLVVTAAGHRSYVLQFRLDGKSWRMAFKDGLTLDSARTEARKHIGDVARGINPLEERRRKVVETAKRASIEANTLRSVAERFASHPEGGAKLRSLKHRMSMFERDIFPTLGRRPISEIKRSEVRLLVDEIRTASGGRSAHQALGYISALMNWYAKRDDDFSSPIVKGMSDFKPSEHARSRMLSDDEIRAVWKATTVGDGANERDRVYCAFVRFTLLTATRRNESAHMARTELHGDDWIIPAARYKLKGEHVIPLSIEARETLSKLPAFKDCPFVFTFDGKKPLNSFSRGQAALKERSGTSDWTLHDLRRTARSLMSRAGIPPDHAERAIGHVMGAMRGTYDRHAYHREKANAFEALATQIDRIIKPPADNVVDLAAAR